jgi:hypothetical protein
MDWLHGGRIYRDSIGELSGAEGIELGSWNSEGEIPMVAVASFRRVVGGGCVSIELESWRLLGDLDICKGGTRIGEAVAARNENGI